MSFEEYTETAELPPFPPTDLPYEDGKPMDSPWHRIQMTILIDSLEHRWRDRADFYCGGNMCVHYSLERALNRDFLGPDFFVALGVERRRRRRYYAIWDERGIAPHVVVELLSPSTADEDRGRKREIYATNMRVPEYFLCDPADHSLEGLRLGHDYRPIPPAADGRVWSGQLGCWFGWWDGEYQGETDTWLRMFEPSGELIRTEGEARGEAARQAAELANSARERAAAAEQHAVAEAAARRAETQRADAEAVARQAAEAELARLRAELAALRPPQP